MTRKLFSRISFFSYLILTLTGFGLGIYLFLKGMLTPAEGWEGLGNAIAIILGIFCLIYAVVTLIPTILKGLDLRLEKNILTIFTMVFDVLLIGGHAFLVTQVLSDNYELFAVIVVIVMALLSVVSLISNILCLTAKY